MNRFYCGKATEFAALLRAIAPFLSTQTAPRAAAAAGAQLAPEGCGPSCGPSASAEAARRESEADLSEGVPLLSIMRQLERESSEASETAPLPLRLEEFRPEEPSPAHGAEGAGRGGGGGGGRGFPAPAAASSAATRGYDGSALLQFMDLCSEVDLLRKFALLNYLAVTKVVKKHDKVSPLRLSTAFTEFASQQPFCTSNRLIDTFLQCQAIVADFVTLDTSDACLRPTAYRCSLCDRQLAMGIVMAGSQRHCHHCLARIAEAAISDDAADASLEPRNVSVDPLLDPAATAALANAVALAPLDGNAMRAIATNHPLLSSTPSSGWGGGAAAGGAAAGGGAATSGFGGIGRAAAPSDKVEGEGGWSGAHAGFGAAPPGATDGGGGWFRAGAAGGAVCGMGGGEVFACPRATALPVHPAEVPRGAPFVALPGAPGGAEGGVGMRPPQGAVEEASCAAGVGSLQPAAAVCPQMGLPMAVAPSMGAATAPAAYPGDPRMGGVQQQAARAAAASRAGAERVREWLPE